MILQLRHMLHIFNGFCWFDLGCASNSGVSSSATAELELAEWMLAVSWSCAGVESLVPLALCATFPCNGSATQTTAMRLSNAKAAQHKKGAEYPPYSYKNPPKAGPIANPLVHFLSLTNLWHLISYKHCVCCQNSTHDDT